MLKESSQLLWAGGSETAAPPSSANVLRCTETGQRNMGKQDLRAGLASKQGHFSVTHFIFAALIFPSS